MYSSRFNRDELKIMGWVLTLFFLAIILSVLSTIPIIVGVILCLTVISKNPWVFLAAILGGLFVDLLGLRTLGATSLFLVVFAFMIFLYQRRFEIQTVPFVFLACFIGSMVYLIVFGYNQILVQAVVSSVLAVLAFRLVSSRFKVSS